MSVIASGRTSWLLGVIRSEMGRLVARGGLALVVKVLGAATSFLMFVLLARTMGADEFGRLGFAFSAATFLAIVAALGHFTLLLRFIPIYLDANDHRNLNSLLSYSLRRVAVGIVATFLFIVLAGCLYAGPSQWLYAVLTAILTLAFVTADYCMNLLRSLGGVLDAIAPRILFWRVAMVLASAACIYFSIELKAEQGLLLLSLTLLAIVALQVLHAKNRLRGSLACQSKHTATSQLEECDSSGDPQLLVGNACVSQWKKAAFWFWGVSVTQATMQNVGIVIVGLILTAAETGKFFVLVRISMVLGMPLMAVSVVVPPLLSKYYSKKQFDSMQSLCSCMAGVASMVIAAGLLALFLFGDRVIAQFDESYVDGYFALMIACTGILVDALFGPTGYIMLMTGFEKKFMSFVVGANLVAISLLCILTYHFGVVGASMSLLLGAIMWNSLVWVWCRRNLGIDPTVLGLIPMLRPKAVVYPSP